MVRIRLLWEHRENECLSEVNRFSSIRESLWKDQDKPLESLEFLKCQNGPFSLLPFSQKKIERIGTTSGLRSDGFVNLSSKLLLSIDIQA